MPKVVEIEGDSVMVYTRDEHPPAHVHVRKNESVIKIQLHENAVEYLSYKGAVPTQRQIVRAAEIVASQLENCWNVWRQYHELNP